MTFSHSLFNYFPRRLIKTTQINFKKLNLLNGSYHSVRFKQELEHNWTNKSDHQPINGSTPCGEERTSP